MDKRSDAMRQAVDVLESGGSAQIFGNHGSGKSMFLARIAASFSARGWQVLRLRGNRSFSSTPLMALALAGVTAAESGRVGAVGAAVNELETLLPAQRSLIVIDDAELLDDTSGGVISELLARRSISLLVGRESRSTQNRTRDFDWLSNPFGVGIRLGHLNYDDLSKVVSHQLQGAVGSAAMSQIFAASGGNPGLAIAITASARYEGTLINREGEWVSTGSLWSDSLAPYVESILAQLRSDQWDALETLALLGVVEAHTFLELTAPDTPVELEELSLIEFYPADGQLFVTVSPPLLVDYFRHRPAVARRYRLSAALEERFPGDAKSLTRFQARELATSSDAPFVRLVHEHLRNRLILAQSEWSRSPSQATAAQLIEASLDSDASAEDVQALFTSSESLAGDEAAAIKWALLRAEFLILFPLDHRAAIDYLERQAPRYQQLGVLLTIRAFEIRSSVERAAGPVDLPDPGDEALDPRVRSALHAAIGMHAMLQGKLGQASEHLTAASHHVGRDETYDRVALQVLNNYFGSKPHEARAIGERGQARAIAAFSSLEIRSYSYLTALMGVLDGRTRSVERAIRVTLSLGEPVRRPPFVHITLLVIGAVLAARRGDDARVHTFMAQLGALEAPDSPVPGGSRCWAEAQILASNGQAVQAADHMQRSADSDFERGLTLTAAFHYLLALEFDPTAERLAATRDRIAQVESEYFAVFLRYIGAIVDRDIEGLRTAATLFERAGRFGHALAALQRAHSFAEESGQEAAAVLEHLQTLQQELPSDDFAEIVTTRATPRFTTRELQIAALAVGGMSNQEIADELVLSIRTVESHMHRVMKKAGAETRGDLSAVVSSRGPVSAWE
ncbi:LuxR C-terminal-related transcriptional regulator [Leucobacter albus]|uniref:LuxR C-terminal-related transcriptional regulator n=1 Tax=Leucobacter albus TaxID=272210 RepID=A0ABW3TMJ4_9MICO